jgi:hypothetical protein
MIKVILQIVASFFIVWGITWLAPRPEEAAAPVERLWCHPVWDAEGMRINSTRTYDRWLFSGYDCDATLCLLYVAANPNATYLPSLHEQWTNLPWRDKVMIDRWPALLSDVAISPVYESEHIGLLHHDRSNRLFELGEITCTQPNAALCKSQRLS